MKSLMPTASVVFAVLFSFILSESLWMRATAGENQCFTCHTNPRKLIQITREIAKAKKGLPAKSSHSEGEG